MTWGQLKELRIPNEEWKRNVKSKKVKYKKIEKSGNYVLRYQNIHDRTS